MGKAHKHRARRTRWYIPERILEVESSSRVLVKWRGYPNAKATWEPQTEPAIARLVGAWREMTAVDALLMLADNFETVDSPPLHN